MGRPEQGCGAVRSETSASALAETDQPSPASVGTRLEQSPRSFAASGVRIRVGTERGPVCRCGWRKRFCRPGSAGRTGIPSPFWGFAPRHQKKIRDRGEREAAKGRRRARTRASASGTNGTGGTGGGSRPSVGRAKARAVPPPGPLLVATARQRGCRRQGWPAPGGSCRRWYGLGRRSGLCC